MAQTPTNSSIEVTLMDGTKLDCSRSTSLPAACHHPDGSRLIIKADERFASATSMSPDGNIRSFVLLKQVKWQDQLIYESAPYPGMGMGGFGPGFPGDGNIQTPLQNQAPLMPPNFATNEMPTPRSTYRADLMIYMGAVSNLEFVKEGMTDPYALEVLEEMQTIANQRLEAARQNINPKKVEIELENDTKASCDNLKSTGPMPCPIYRCHDPKNSFFVDNQFGTPSLITLDESNQIQRNDIVDLVWNQDNRSKPIFENIKFSPFIGTGGMGGGMLGSYARPSEQMLQEQANRRAQFARERPSIETEQPQLLDAFIDPMYRSIISGMTDACDATQIEPLVSGINSIRQKVADAQMVQLVEVTNNILTSRLINPEAVPDNACREGDAWYRDDSFAFSREVLAQNSPKTIDLEMATRLFNEARQMDDIAWDYKSDGCYARAHLMARRFEQQGIEVDKVWIKGDLSVPDAGIQWNFHVAPIVYVEDENGDVQRMVIDPSLMDGPVTVEQWSARMQKGVIGETIETQYPFPANVANFERTAIAYSNSDPYLPFDQISMTEEEKMAQSRDTMDRYLGFLQ